MSREIKFRAYDRANNYMFYPDIEEKSNFTRKIDVLRVGSDFDYNSLFDGFHENLIPLQYTGLKDKNGKDIYEGDILTDHKGDKRAIEFIEGGFWCAYPSGDKFIPAENIREVIGNIYEHPKLIQQ